MKSEDGPEKITQDRLKQLVEYHCDTGEFTWLQSRQGNRGVGSIAGSVTSQGYRELSLDGKRYLAHRMAFLYALGVAPDDEVDHINGHKLDNSFKNLRLSTRAQNKQNTLSARRHNKSGFLGVSFSTPMKKFEARIQAQGVIHRLGYFDDPKDAHSAYVVAKRNLHEFCNL